MLSVIVCFSFGPCLVFFTFDFGFSLCFVVLIGLPSVFDYLPVASFMILVSHVHSVCWKTDRVCGLSLCIWITCITQISACNNFVCLTLIELNTHLI